MPDTEITDMIVYYSRLMTGRVLNPLYLNYSHDDFNGELRLLILSVNDGLIKGRMISAMLDKTEHIVADETIYYLEKQKNKLNGLCNYLKQCRGTQHKKEIKSTALILIDGKRPARTVLTGMCYSVGSATRQGSSSFTRLIGQSAMTLST